MNIFCMLVIVSGLWNSLRIFLFRVVFPSVTSSTRMGSTWQVGLRVPNDLQERLERRDTAAVEDSALGRCASVKGWWEEGVVGFLCRIGRFYAFLRWGWSITFTLTFAEMIDPIWPTKNHGVSSLALTPTPSARRFFGQAFPSSNTL